MPRLNKQNYCLKRKCQKASTTSNPELISSQKWIFIPPRLLFPPASQARAGLKEAALPQSPSSGAPAAGGCPSHPWSTAPAWFLQPAHGKDEGEFASEFGSSKCNTAAVSGWVGRWVIQSSQAISNNDSHIRLQEQILLTYSEKRNTSVLIAALTS